MSNEAEWQSLAEELAGALQATILRNPSLPARDWDRAHAALGHYERVAGGPAKVGSEDLLKGPSGELLDSPKA